MRSSCRDVSVTSQEMITHEAAELTASKIWEPTRSRGLQGVQKHQHLNLGVYVGFLLLPSRKFALGFIQSPTVAQNSSDRGSIHSQFEDAERLPQTEGAFR